MIGIPRALFYHLFKDKWLYFFKELNIDYILSPETNKEILALGNKYTNDEMCLSLKEYIGHVAYLQDKCDYVLVPRIENYGIDDQMCTNFLSIYDIVHNLFKTKILHYNINYNEGKTEEKSFIKIAKILGKTTKEAKTAYKRSYNISNHLEKIEINHNLLKLNSTKTKILLISHPYNTYDSYIGKPILKIFMDNDIEVIDSSLFDKEKASKLSINYSKTLYWKYSKEIIGSIDMARVDGIVFLSTFPCGLDSLVNELLMRKIKIPYLNIVVDEMYSLAGFETRIESFVDLIKERVN